MTLENEARWQVIKGADADGKKIWTFFNRKDMFRDDEFGFVGISVSGSTDKTAHKATGTVGISFGEGCTSDRTDPFDEFKVRRAKR